MPLNLIDIVHEYSDLGFHRTGTDVDTKTNTWFARYLKTFGASVSCPPYAFDRFDYDVTLLSDGAVVESLPLFYHCVGQVETDRVAVVELSMDHADNGMDAVIDGLCRNAVAEGYQALVLATMGATGALVAVNRGPGRGNDIPVVLVPGHASDELQRSELFLHYDAQLFSAQSANVVARFGESHHASRMVLTTPLSGWFSCAGERGTGIAVVLALAEEFASRVPMTVIGATGHELGMMGGFLSAGDCVPHPESVFHIGSCVASRGDDGQEPDAALTSDLQTTLHVDSDVEAHVIDAVKSLNGRLCRVPGTSDPGQWVGESRCWAGKTRNMISVAGASPLFHTVDDVAVRATTPSLLSQAHGAIRGAFCHFTGNG